MHALEHASFFTAGIALWWPLIQPVPMRHRMTGMWPFAYIGAAKLGLAGLGLYLTWSTSVAYEHYETVPRIWGLTAVEDQNVGGAMMMLEQSRGAADRLRRAVRADADPVRGGRAATRAPRAGGGRLSALLERLGVELPVVQAGMGGGLAAARWRGAVSDAGGLGTVGFDPPERMRAEIAAARARSDGRPVAANLLLPFARRGTLGGRAAPPTSS